MIGLLAESQRNGGIRFGWGVALAYAVMSLIDCLGALSSQVGLVNVSSMLFFAGFAIVPVPFGNFCCRVGTGRALRLALMVSALASVLLGVGAAVRPCLYAGLSLAGLANVCLQVVVPVFVAERFSLKNVASCATGGLFVRMAVAVAFPFLVAWSASRGCWWASLAPFVLFSVLSIAVLDDMPQGVVEKGDSGFTSVSFRKALSTPSALGAVAAFAIAIVADVVFNLSVPGIVSQRFDAGTTGAVYAVWFCVKLPFMLLGARLFLRLEARRFFGMCMLVSLGGAVLMLTCREWGLFLVGVALFAAGFANVYGHVFDAAVARCPEEVGAVSALLVMAISAGAVASPLLALVENVGICQPEGLVVGLTALLVPIAALLGFVRRRA